ncbi:MAG: hypothetical protein ISR65_18965 [Bacteriovoracaceae bacterium]|nr:hypothetical protein [Bacteriovoracaceae bacterium]
MSFVFKELTLKNWRCYEGTITINFPDISQGRNLIVVNGINGFGKTSLLKSLKFLFHGTSKDEILEAWNDVAKSHGDKSVTVSMTFTHNKSLCKIIREVEFKERGNTALPSESLTLIVDGVERDQAEDKISQWLPKDVQQFVFFDGAEISRYAKKQHDQGVKDAIERVLGIPAIRNLRTDLSRLLDNLEEDQETLVGLEGKSATLIAHINELEALEENYREEKETHLEQKSGIEETLSDLEKEATKIEVIEAERKALLDKKARQSDLQSDLDETEKHISEHIRHAPLYLLLPKLRELESELNAKVKIPASHEKWERLEIVYSDLIENGEKCLCGRELDDKSERHLQEELSKVRSTLEKLKSTSGKGGKKEMTNKLLSVSQIINLYGENQNSASEILRKRSSLNIRLEEIENDISDLNTKLEGHELVEVQELFRQKADLRNRLEELQESLGVLKENMQKTVDNLRDKRRELDQLTIDNAQGHRLVQELNLVRSSQAAVDGLLNQAIEERRNQIEKLSSEVYISITNKPEEYSGVRVKEDYTLEVIRRDGTSVDNTKLSSGEKEVLAYSFITALNRSSITPVPFVMDTPFGHLDSTHREKLLKNLPSLNVQVFLLATDRDLPANERDKIDDFLAGEFEIKRDQAAARSYIEEIV